jgi:tRNA-(ms[2]io[6]A)-hydroxylase
MLRAVLHLHAPTDPAWLPGVLPHIDEILLDHAHLEKKAAANAVNLIFRLSPRLPEAAEPLSALAREELEHFEQVLALMKRRGIAFARQYPAPYGERLKTIVRDGHARMVDELLCAALIEARSCERMQLLADGVPDPEISALYRDLLASEARHHAFFVDLAAALRPREEVRARLAEIAIHEAEILQEPCDLPRLHG